MMRYDERFRQTGRTTRQMQNAPKGAIYVWPNSHIEQARRMAKDLGRDDLEIISAMSFCGERMRGRRITACVLDHAVEMTRNVVEAREYIRYATKKSTNS